MSYTGFMLPKKKRLTTAEFNRFFSSGKRFHSTSLQLIYSPHPTFHGSVVVGKKVYKSAVKRNKLRRQLYDLLRNQESGLETKGVFIITTKPAAKEADFKTLKVELSNLLGKLTDKQ